MPQTDIVPGHGSALMANWKRNGQERSFVRHGRVIHHRLSVPLNPFHCRGFPSNDETKPRHRFGGSVRSSPIPLNLCADVDQKRGSIESYSSWGCLLSWLRLNSSLQPDLEASLLPAPLRRGPKDGSELQRVCGGGAAPPGKRVGNEIADLQERLASSEREQRENVECGSGRTRSPPPPPPPPRALEPRC